jgi:predicted house-cleaning NTP pyrophosphatase (Maf/HAM1 superfamily)
MKKTISTRSLAAPKAEAIRDAKMTAAMIVAMDAIMCLRGEVIMSNPKVRFRTA